MAPTEVKVVVGVLAVRVVGIGSRISNWMSVDTTVSFAGTANKSDCPVSVTPFSIQVARALTRPKFAGTLGMFHDPSGETAPVLFKMLTTQFSLSCAQPGLLARRQNASPTKTA